MIVSQESADVSIVEMLIGRGRTRMKGCNEGATYRGNERHEPEVHRKFTES